MKSQVAAANAPLKDSEARRSFIDDRIRLWNLQNRTYLDFAHQNSSRGLMVSYEALIGDDYKTLRRLFDFLRFRLTKKQIRILGLKKGRGATPPEERADALTEEEVDCIEKGTEKVRESLNKYLITGS